MVFAGIVGIDIIATAILFGSEISEFINDLLGGGAKYDYHGI
jgi:hypothetical protein